MFIGYRPLLLFTNKTLKMNHVIVEENSDPFRKGELDQKKHLKMDYTTCLTQLFFLKYKNKDTGYFTVL